MMELDIFELIDRIAALIRSEERKKCAEVGLQSVHVQVLDYLSRCNRFSDMPASVTSYLGLTKGTVSQTLIILEKKGYISKVKDIHDKRVVHLKINQQGLDILQQAKPNDLFSRASSLLQGVDQPAIREYLGQTLMALQQANQSQAFGLCKNCKYFTQMKEGYLCGLTQEPLAVNESTKICQEFSVL